MHTLNKTFVLINNIHYLSSPLKMYRFILPFEMDFQLSYFHITICIVFSRNWLVTFEIEIYSNFLWFLVCFKKPVIFFFFSLSSLTFIGRKRIYQQDKVDLPTDSMLKILPEYSIPCYLIQMIWIFTLGLDIVRFNSLLFWKYGGSQNTMHQYSFYDFWKRTRSCAPLGKQQSSHWPEKDKTWACAELRLLHHHLSNALLSAESWLAAFSTVHTTPKTAGELLKAWSS